jgi:predicted nucleic acid-binding protein
VKKYLLDTNAVAERRNPKPHGGVLDWPRELRDEQLLLGQGLLADCNEEWNERGLKIVSKLRRLNRVERLAASAQILPMDAVCFGEGARLLQGEQEHLLEDRMIAATARIHGLIVATRNEGDFLQLDVAVVNPFRGEGCSAEAWKQLVPRVIDRRYRGK